MAVSFEETSDAVRLVQTRRGMRITFAVIMVTLVLGVVLQLVLGSLRFDTTLACSHEDGTCTLTKGKSTHSFPLGSLLSVRLDTSTDQTASWVWLVEDRTQELCGAKDVDGRAAAQAFADDANAFLKDTTHPPIELHCVSQSVNGPGFTAALAAFGGWLFIMLMFSPYSHEITLTIDKRAGTLHSKGRGWLIRAWDVSRALTEVERVELRSRYAGYGARRYFAVAVFHDGEQVLLWSPAAGTKHAIDERVAALRAAILGGRHG